MYSNSIVKIERCDGAIEDEPEVDPFMDISSLRSRVKVEVSEGVLAHSSIDLKPELPIPPVQNEKEFHPGEFLQVKIEELKEAIKPKISESSDKDEIEDSSSVEEDNAPMGKYDGVFFKDVMEDFIEKYQPNPSLLIILKNEPCLRFLPQLGSVRCEPCYLVSNSSGISSKEGYKFQKPTNKAASIINKHISTKGHLQYTANSNICNQTDPKEFSDLDEPGVFLNDSILKLYKSKSSAPSRLFRILEYDMKGNQCLVYLQNYNSFRCEVCYRSNVRARSKKYDFSRGIDGKRGIILKSNKDLAMRIFQHFITDEHSALLKKRKYFETQKSHKRPKLSPPNSPKVASSSSTPSNPSNSPVDGSSPMEINKATLKLIKSQINSNESAYMNVLIKDSSEDRCLVYLPALKSIRCEICFRDDGIRGLSIKKRGDLVRKGGMKDFNSNKAKIINGHLKSQRHVQVVLKEKRNGRNQKKSLPIESPSLINPVNVKIEPGFGSNPMNFEGESDELNGADSIQLPGIVIESVDIKEEKPGI